MNNPNNSNNSFNYQPMLNTAMSNQPYQSQPFNQPFTQPVATTTTTTDESASVSSTIPGDLQDVDSDDAELRPGKRSGRRKIKIEYIEDKSRRHITFSKRKAGIMKKAYELSTLTGTQVLLLVVSETGLVYTFTTPKLQPLVTKPEGKSLIQECLNAPDLSHLPPHTSSSSSSSSMASSSGADAQQHHPNANIGNPTSFQQRSTSAYSQSERKPVNYNTMYPQQPYNSTPSQLRTSYPPSPSYYGNQQLNDYWQRPSHIQQTQQNQHQGPQK